MGRRKWLFGVMVALTVGILIENTFVEGLIFTLDSYRQYPLRYPFDVIVRWTCVVAFCAIPFLMAHKKIGWKMVVKCYLAGLVMALPVATVWYLAIQLVSWIKEYFQIFY